MVKRIIKDILFRNKYTISKFSVKNNPDYQISKILEYNNCSVVFDVGANCGQFASDLIRYNFQGKIISFEPSSEAHNNLMLRSRKFLKWIIHERIALGNKDDKLILNISSNSVSSSILNINEIHKNSAKDSEFVSREEVYVKKLDDIFIHYVVDSDIFFLKIDTQGFEKNVLDGANLALKKAKGIIVELSLVELYDGQPLWEEILQILKKYDFNLWAIQPGFTDSTSGRAFQVNGIFV